jgi:hypothetical protein
VSEGPSRETVIPHGVGRSNLRVSALETYGPFVSITDQGPVSWRTCIGCAKSGFSPLLERHHAGAFGVRRVWTSPLSRREDHSRCAKGRPIVPAENRTPKTPGMVASFAERVTLKAVTLGESAETPRPAPCGEAIVGFKSLPMCQQGFELRANISPTGVVVKLVLRFPHQV